MTRTLTLELPDEIFAAIERQAEDKDLTPAQWLLDNLQRQLSTAPEPVKSEDNYRRLFERLPIGVYRLDAEDRFVEVNQAWCEMLGYKSVDEVKGKLAEEFYADPEEAHKFREYISHQDSVIDRRLKLQKKNGEHIYVAVSAFKDSSSEGEYTGRAGTMMDVSKEERYKSILEGVPVGLYIAREVKGEDFIQDFNRKFIELLEFDCEDDARGFKIKDLHNSPEEYNKFIEAIYLSPNHLLNGYKLKVKTRKGREKIFEINSRLMRNIHNEVIGRVGAIRDVSEEVELKEKEEYLIKKVNELTNDIGAILHTPSSTLVMIKHSVEAIISSLKPDPFDKVQELQATQAADALAGPTKNLAELLERLLKLAGSGDRLSALSNDEWEQLENLLRIFQDYRSIAPFPESYPSILREAAISVIGICDDIQKGKLPREKIREVRAAASELLRICNLIALHQISDVTIEIDHVLRALREYVVTGSQTVISRTISTAPHLVSQAVNRLQGFAKSRGVKLDVADIPLAQVEVAEHDVSRAIANILHNAIKYSWSRKRDEAPWIAIRARVDHCFVYIDFENWGVAIPKEEIEQGLIFKLGYRGSKSSDRGRAGTGIGLTDARRVALAHGGDVLIKSHPARPGGRDNDYDQPFLTTATIKLPLYSRP
jgi:PAS domain S-box-containing protein